MSGGNLPEADRHLTSCKHFIREGAYLTMVASYELRVIHFKPYGLNFLF
ncbi:hypothetical protein ES705_16156 [subsurface metagenome]